MNNSNKPLIKKSVMCISAAPLLKDIPEEVPSPEEPVTDNMTKEEKVDLLKQELEQELEEENQPEVDELVNPLWINDPDLSKFNQKCSCLLKICLPVMVSVRV